MTGQHLSMEKLRWEPLNAIGMSSDQFQCPAQSFAFLGVEEARDDDEFVEKTSRSALQAHSNEKKHCAAKLHFH